MLSKTEKEELLSLILSHMHHRDKLLLLHLREPFPRKMKKLEFLLN
jgi:hypothetical protein